MIQPDPLNEREFELINIVGANLGANQRDISHLMDLSLGMTNMLLRRLVSKGYIRVNQLNKRKVEYLLTPKGFAEKMRKAVKYTLKTINSIGLIKNRVKEVILKCHQEGERNFFLLGASDLATLARMAIEELELTDTQVSTIQSMPPQKISGTVLVCHEDVPGLEGNINKYVDLLAEIGNDVSMVKV